MRSEPSGAASGEAARFGRLPIDGVVAPVLLLLVAADVLLHDPHRVLAWRLFHEPALAAVPSWITPLLPRPSGQFDLDPVALLLGAVAVGAAAAYLFAVMAAARPRIRALILGLAAALLVVAPTLAFVAMGHATGRPYGQDGGVVQLPLALERILGGLSPYGADYSATMLGRQARVSEFWAGYGDNPILHHHAYLPGTHLLMMPFYLASRPLLGGFDSRLVTLLAYALAAVLAARLVQGPSRRLAAAAVVLVNPLVYWHETFGANDLLMAALLLLAVWFARKERPFLSAAMVGLACSTKQLAWPFAPFLLCHLAGPRRLGELVSVPVLRRLARMTFVAAAVFVAVVAPVAALDVRAFWRDVVGYNIGLRGADAYPLGGTPGLGFANLLIYTGAVSSLREHVSFAPFYLLLAPLALALLVRTMRHGRASSALVAGGASLLASLYFSRVFHPNYLVLAAVLLPVALLMEEELPPDAVVVPLALVGMAVEMAEHEVLRTAGEQVLPRAQAILGPLAPRAGPDLTHDPFGLALSALAAGLAVLYLVSSALGAGRRWRGSLAVAAVIVTVLAPGVLVISAGSSAGPLRAQDAWLTGVLPADGGSSAKDARVLQAWSTSFRRDPPTTLDAPVAPGPGAPAFASFLRFAGVRDPRVVLLAIAIVAGWLTVMTAPEGSERMLSAVVLVSASALSIIFGSPAVLATCALLAARALTAAGKWLAAALVIGSTGSVVPAVWFAAPFVLLAGPDPPIRRLLSGVLVGFTIMALPGIVSQPGSLLAGLVPPDRVQPGVGLPNVLIYFGAEDSMLARAGGWLLPVVVAAVAILCSWRRRLRHEPFTGAALAWIVGAWATSGFCALGLAVPIPLLVLSAVSSGVFGAGAQASVGGSEGRRP